MSDCNPVHIGAVILLVTKNRKKMALLPAQKMFQTPLVLVLFVLMFLCTNSESSSGSGVNTHLMPVSWSVADSGRFSVITYNVAGLPGLISGAVTKRSTSISRIGVLLNQFDIAHVQEDFNYNKHLYQKNTHAFRTATKGKVPFGDGLNTLSRFPVHNVRRVAWKDCTGADCFTPKGFSYSSVEVARGVFIDFYNVHANAFNHQAAAAARRKNIKQLSDYIQEHSAGHALVVMGDLNGHFSYFYDNLGVFCSENSLSDVWLQHNRQGMFPEILKGFPDDNILDLSDSCETIDKILYRSSRKIELIPGNYKFENLGFLNSEGLPLSDHHPVSASFSWRQLAEKQPAPGVVFSKNK
jgi:hypothetical protein